MRFDIRFFEYLGISPGMLPDQGIDDVNLGGPLGPDPMEAIRLLGSRVIPYFGD